MRIFVLSLTLISFMPQLLSAADSSVPADGSGYLDDRKLQMPVTAAPTNSKKKPVKKVVADDHNEPAPVLTQVSGSAPVAEGEGEGFPLVPVIVGALVLAGLVGGGVFFARRRKTESSVPPPRAATPVAAPPQVRSPTAASLSRPPAPQTSVKLPPAAGAQPEGISINGLSNNEISRLTSVDDRGRNPSGIIIDEDKYFSGGKESFVDEDRS